MNNIINTHVLIETNRSAGKYKEKNLIKVCLLLIKKKTLQATAYIGTSYILYNIMRVYKCIQTRAYTLRPLIFVLRTSNDQSRRR